MLTESDVLEILREVLLLDNKGFIMCFSGGFSRVTTSGS